MAGLPEGALVEINGLTKKAEPTPGSKAEALELNGQRAQLVEFDRDSKQWVAVTFTGLMVTVEERYCRVLTADEVSAYDFVLGPKSSADIVGRSLAECLAQKGYATMKTFVSPADAEGILSAARRLDEEAHFSRLAVEFERGYLGVEGSGKTMLMDLRTEGATPEYVTESGLKTLNENFDAFSFMLTKHSSELLGFHIQGRTQTLLSMPLVGEDENKYPPADTDDKDAEEFLHIMHRKKLTAIQFLGPETGSLKLLPVREEGQEVTLSAEPHTILFFLASHFELNYLPEGESLAISTFYLREPAVVNPSNIKARMAMDAFTEGSAKPPPGEHVSVDSMYCRYGMNADGKDQMWCAIKASCDGLTDVPLTRWDASQVPEDMCYTKHGCFGIENVELFDCKFFDISPAEARGMDPCQRQVMEVSYVVLLEGGFDKQGLGRTSQNIGHFVGIDKDDWLCMTPEQRGQDIMGGFGAASAANAITSNRFSYSLNLKGASMTIDTACSSSLVCTHVAKLHLKFKEFDPMVGAIVNGLNLMLFPGPFIACCGASMLSHDGRCFTFDASADGYARGELCGAIHCKLHQYDEKSIACVAGSQVNQDGRSASLTAPNGPAQERCLKAVLREVNLPPDGVDCFECHGTGTSLGDPIEVGSFRKVFSAKDRDSPLLITSSKSNIGHGEGGAGLAGFFKCVLQVSHCEAGSNVHLRSMNPHLDTSGFPCVFLSESRSMKGDSAYSGVSSFGFGGTNAHGEAWGKNIFTSMSAANVDQWKLFQRKLQQAPPAEVTIVGDDVRDWETTGLPPDAEPYTKFTVEVDEDGLVNWEVEDDDDDDFDSFFIQGSHTHWEQEEMDQHDSVIGCFTSFVTIGTSGEESFQIVADGEEDKVFFPEVQRCTSKVAEVCGPEKEEDRSRSWLIRGPVGSVFRVEVFLQAGQRSVMWLRQS